MIHRGHHHSAAGTSTDEPQDWREHAACLDEDTELFFPLGKVGSKAYEAAAAEAKAICQRCDSIADCLEDVLRTGDSFGIRGGLDPDERSAQFPTPKKRSPAYPCAVCGVGMGAPKRKGRFVERYCSDACRAEARRRQQAAYDARRKGKVAA